MIKHVIVIALLLGLSVSLQAVRSSEPDADGIAFFENKIRPLLHEYCIECHSDAEPESGLSLESYEGLIKGGKLGATITPGKPKESLLISAVNHDEFLKMPPKSKLTTVQLAALSQWVSMGAPWPNKRAETKPAEPNGDSDSNSPTENTPKFTEQQKSFWAYQPLKRADIPQLPDELSQSTRTAIDAFVSSQLALRGIQPSGPAGKRQLLRRVTYDLTGLSPTNEEFAAFESNEAPDAYERAVDRLLASPRYGEKWGRHWLDVARYADSNGLDENIGYPHAFRYRDYVIDSFNSDKPYDRFVQEQIAGDLLPGESSRFDRTPFDRVVATGFLAIGAKMLAEDDPMKMQMDIIDEQLTVLCQAFMGMTIGCARCHDHKYDPLTAADYYALAGIFKSSKTMENHNVVAKLFERQLADPDKLAVAKQIDERLESKKAELNKLHESIAQRTRQQIRASVRSALIATVAYDQFTKASSDQLQTGVNYTDAAGPGYQADHADQAYVIDNGYKLIEAEGYHRGTVDRDYNEYGQDIGVIGSNGAAYVEYDFELAQAGSYAIELRYAAVERRPVRMKIDGKELNARVATETSDSWHKDGQMWTVAGLARLTAGKHVLRFESRRVFPHIDKLSIVYQTPPGQPWPYGQAPLALSRAGLVNGTAFPILALWRNHLGEIKRSIKDDSSDLNFYAVWLRLAGNIDDFAAAAEKTWMQLGEQSSLATQTPDILRDALLAQRPTSIDDLASVYAATIERVLAAPEGDEGLKKVREHLMGKSSPLGGPKADYDRYYTVEDEGQAEKVNEELAAIEAERPQLPIAIGISEDKPEDLKIHLRGSHLVLGKLVSRRMPSVLSRPDDPPINHESSGRLQLAQWLTRPDHPLTSRVIANRVWHWHFGRGIVPTTDNFGMLGLPPTNPELLDWLALELVEHEWSLKDLHRQILLSATYQRSSRTTASDEEDARRIEHAQAIDPENQTLWRFRRRRMTAEETRDSILDVGGALELSMYGSHMKTASHSYVNTAAGGDLDYSQPRRSVYLPVIRSGVLDELQTLDFPDPAMIAGERQTSTVAPQALMMLNSDLVHEQSLSAAKRLLEEPSDTHQRIELAYQRILRRQPIANELQSASNFIDRAMDQGVEASTAWQSLCRVLIASSEFSYIE